MTAAFLARMQQAISEAFNGSAARRDDYLEGVDIMSPEEAARVMSPTDPDRCDCDHEGLPVGFHRQWCEVSDR